jgi:hypothetical protein
LNDRDKTIAMTLPDIKGNISAKNKYYIMMTIPDWSYEGGVCSQIFSWFYKFYFLRYSPINPKVHNIATVLSLTVCRTNLDHAVIDRHISNVAHNMRGHFSNVYQREIFQGPKLP